MDEELLSLGELNSTLRRILDCDLSNYHSLPNFSRDLNAIMNVIRELDCETLYKFGHNWDKRTKSLGSEEASRAKLAPRPWELCLVLIKTLNEKNSCAN